ncbi:hypothetical protein HN51_063098 [Arachis hypogaea]|uniref:Large ribosomal subunit protein bL12 C-terminal domain-containing protein n=1 Tax=Arachis hypogaea TaxID=3818 RepID=A0A445AZ64_ARAHY|nr:uncharacterized protein LOC107634932 [Arachis ipaensis]XP_025629491.1 uncharacterized protein LOC112722613 [Arachis hypogaea]XP_025629492.1 uncharacterized protein LOC112722613 [Arachis hypogaea]QHO20752.1 54S ribosomal protein [Arachis hypogaea]RYR31723.1 hypothetical protein Ahy_B01g056598 [Arachis hypogaea]
MRCSRFLHVSQQIRRILIQNPKSNHQSQLQSRPAIFARNFSTDSSSQDSNPVVKSEKASLIVDELTALTLMEVVDLVEIMQKKKGINELPLMMLMTPGMELGGLKGALRKRAAKGGGGAGAGAAGEEAKKEEKTVFDVKLDAFDAAAKIKVIKEVRTFTSLGLKEAKDLVEKVPTVLKKGLTKEEAEAIIAKLKEVGAKASME